MLRFFASAVMIALLLSTSAYAQIARGHWELMTSKEPVPDSVTLIVGFANDRVYYLTAHEGIFRSDDAGQSLRVIPIPFDASAISQIGVAPNSRIIAIVAGEVYQTSNDSIWTLSGSPLKGSPGASVTAIAFDSHSNAFIGTSGAGIFELDAAKNWRQIITPKRIGRVQSMVFDAQGQLVVSGDSIYRLSPNMQSIARSWKGYGTLIKLGQSIYFKADKFYALSDSTLRIISTYAPGNITVDSNGILYSFDWGSWPSRSIDSGLSWQEYKYDAIRRSDLVEAIRSGCAVASRSENWLGMSFDIGRSMSYIRKLDSAQTYNVFTDKEGTVRAFGISDWKSTDHGYTWQRTLWRSQARTYQDDGKYYAYYNNQHRDTLVVYEAGALHDGLRALPHISDTVQVSSFSAASTGMFYVGCSNGQCFSSSDGGDTWHPLALFKDWQYEGGQTSPIESVIEQSGALYVASYWMLHRSLDGGGSWTSTKTISNQWLKTGRAPDVLLQTTGDGVTWINGSTPLTSEFQVALFTGGPVAEGPDQSFLAEAYDPFGQRSQEVSLIEQRKNILYPDTIMAIPKPLLFGSLSLDSSLYLFGGAGAWGGEALHRTAGGVWKYVPESGVAEQSNSEPSIALRYSDADNSLRITSVVRIESVTIVNMLGEIVASYDHALEGRIALPRLPHGCYVVRIANSSGVECKRIVL